MRSMLQNHYGQFDEKTLISNIGGFTGIGKEFLWLIILMLSSFSVIITYFNCKRAVH